MDNLLRKVKDHFHPPSTKIQIQSDLHLELCHQYTTYTFPHTAPYLILAGDIGRLIDYDRYLTFLAAQTSRFKRVFLILGNHEFYEMTYEKAVEAARKLEREVRLEGRLTLLDRGRWDDAEAGLTILGCTLWSHIPESAREAVVGRVNDYKKIEGWSVEKHNRIHEEEVQWLREQVASVRSEAPQKGDSTDGGDGSSGQPHSPSRHHQLLVVTHHAPVIQGSSKPEQLSNPWAPAFATDLLRKRKDWVGVSTWVFGHTHFTTGFLKSGIRIVANQRGYVFPNEKKRAPRDGEKRYKEFDESFTISLWG